MALEIQSLAKDLGNDSKLEIITDATAAIGICRRRGLGTICRLHVADLWVQDRMREGDVELTRVAGAVNPADLLTKHLARDMMTKLMTAICLRGENGQARPAPTLQHS